MKKTSILWISSLLVFISFASNVTAMEADLQQVQGFNTFRMIHAMLQGIEKAFNPPASPSELEGDGEGFPKMAEAVEVLSGSGVSSALFDWASELVADTKSTHPNLKSSDHRTMAEAAVRVGMKARPQHFSPLEEGPVTPETSVTIFGNFFQEFVQSGSLDGWLSCLNRKIKEKESDGDSDAACQEFVNDIGAFLKQIASKKDPLDKYVDPDEFQEACDLHEWLENNYGHKDYDEKHDRFIELDERIQAARHRAIDEGGQRMFNLLKRSRPELAPLGEMSDFISHEQKRWDMEERKEFEDYILTEYGKLNPFEPNHLRGFWEKLEGHQYGKLCYKIVCESFEGMDSPVHRLVQQIWAVSQLDTIHQKPKESRSRMPVDNFGYRMKDSAAYKAWATNPLARASGDIIMDAYHSMVDLGRELNTHLFLKRFKKYLSNKKADREDRVKYP
ncbi:MAG: hypothetical protein K2Q34_05920, partial [Alphaproteobacteria bacterium]|nr:hypothetical protein [Alphaproteobacteria bacterium]